MGVKWDNHHVSDVEMACVRGGFRTWAWKLMADLVLEPALDGTVWFYDADARAAEGDRITGSQLKERKGATGRWDHKVTYSLKEALKGADFVVISTPPGTSEEVRSNVHPSERLSIYQPVGGAAGPGGMVRALRTLPMYEETALVIRGFCPFAWVISYTNPMSLCVVDLYKIFPEIKAFGCYHEVFSTQRVLAAIASQELGTSPVDRKDIHINVLGVDHFIWFDTASYEGANLFPVHKKYIRTHFEEGYNDPDRPWEESTFNCRHRAKFDLFNRHGSTATAGDRHLAEFTPGNTYLNDPEIIRSRKFRLITMDFRINQMEEYLIRRRRLTQGEGQMETVSPGEEEAQQIKALVDLDRMVSSVNMPNSFLQIPNLPKEAMVEINAVFSCDSIRAVAAGPLSEPVRELVLPHVQDRGYILEAADTYDQNLVVKVFMDGPLVKHKCRDKGEVRKLAGDMIHNTECYLPAGWR